VIVLSDGRFNKNNVRPYLREAKEKNYLYIFVILDSVNKEKKLRSIMDLKNAEKDPETGNIKLIPYLKDFPF